MPIIPTPSELASLARTRTLVRLHRAGLEEGHMDGRVAACSRRLVAFAVLGEGLHPNGFIVVRRDDMSRLDVPAPRAEMYSGALRLRGEKLPRFPRLDLSNWRALITGAARRFPLVTLHVERKDPGVCYIGRPVQLTRRGGTFVTVGPDATWDRDDLLELAWSDVTRVDFDGEYERALALVAAEIDP